jgi:hypothetical protein
VVGVEQWAEVRRMHRVERLSIREISRRTGLHRRTVRRALAAETPPKYERAFELPRGAWLRVSTLQRVAGRARRALVRPRTIDIAEVAAAGSLQQIALHVRHVADLRRRRRQQALLRGSGTAANHWVLRHGGVTARRTDE